MSPAAVHEGFSRRPDIDSIFAVLLRTACLAPMLLGALATRGQTQVRPFPPAVAVSDTVMEIRLDEGSILFGRIVAIDGDRITIELESGTRTELNRADIVLFRRTSSRMVRGKRWEADPDTTRLFLAPTGRPLGRGTGYFAVYDLVMPFLSYGITDRISMSGGTYVSRGVTGKLLYLAPKITLFTRPGVHFSAGALVSAVPAEDHWSGLLYGVGTFGSADRAFTIGGGAPFNGAGLALLEHGEVMVGGEARISRRTKLIGESSIVPRAGGRFALGVRFFGERLSADAGLGFTAGGISACEPFLNFAYVFGPLR